MQEGEEEKTVKRKWVDEGEMFELLMQNPLLHPGLAESPASADHPLHAAISHGRDDLVRYLVEERGHDVNVRTWSGDTPLIHAVFTRRLSTARLLLELGADVELEDGYVNALWHAFINEDRPMIRMLVDHGAKATPEDVKDMMRGPGKQVACFILDRLMEKLFSKVIAGLCSNGTFLDARLLILIASFAYN